MFDDLTNFMKQAKLYAFGKSLLMFATVGAGVLMGLPVLGMAIIAATGGFALTMVRRFYSERLYEDGMVNIYRDNIALMLGKDPLDVTRADLREAAKTNDIIDQALKQQHKKTLLTFGTAALSAVVTVGLVQLFGFDKTLQGLAKENLYGPLAQLVGVSTVASLSSLVVHEGLDALIGYSSGIHRVAAHDLIHKMDLQVQHGKPISREEVFAIMVAGNKELAQRITLKCKKGYAELTQGEKSHVLHELKLAQTMDTLAVAISEKKVRPGHLAYAVHDPRLVGPSEAAEPVGKDAAPTPATPFVERLGLQPRDPQKGFVERLDAAALQPALSSAAR